MTGPTHSSSPKPRTRRAPAEIRRTCVTVLARAAARRPRIDPPEMQRPHLPQVARLLHGLACRRCRSTPGVMQWRRLRGLVVGNELGEVREGVSEVIGGKRWEPDSLSCGLRYR
jgi:hypothetical protein